MAFAISIALFLNVLKVKCVLIGHMAGTFSESPHFTCQPVYSASKGIENSNATAEITQRYLRTFRPPALVLNVGAGFLKNG